MSKIALDFDGVICKREGIIERTHNFTKDFPTDGCKEAIEWLLSMGWEVVIFTSRKHYEWGKIKTWLKKYDIPQLSITNIKENFQVILDDRAIRFIGWQDFIKYYK